MFAGLHVVFTVSITESGKYFCVPVPSLYSIKFGPLTNDASDPFDEIVFTFPSNDTNFVLFGGIVIAGVPLNCVASAKLSKIYKSFFTGDL